MSASNCVAIHYDILKIIIYSNLSKHQNRSTEHEASTLLFSAPVCRSSDELLYRWPRIPGANFNGPGGFRATVLAKSGMVHCILDRWNLKWHYKSSFISTGQVLEYGRNFMNFDVTRIKYSDMCNNIETVWVFGLRTIRNQLLCSCGTHCHCSMGPGSNGPTFSEQRRLVQCHPMFGRTSPLFIHQSHLFSMRHFILKEVHFRSSNY